LTTLGDLDLQYFQTPGTTYLLKQGAHNLTAPVEVTGNRSLCYVVFGPANARLPHTGTVTITPSGRGSFTAQQGSTLGLRGLAIEGSSNGPLTTTSVLGADGSTLLMQGVTVRNLQVAGVTSKQAGPVGVINVHNSTVVIRDTLFQAITGNAGLLTCGSDNSALSPSHVQLQQVGQS
jgi:hypothetical protein